jgi:hypothetical protein
MTFQHDDGCMASYYAPVPDWPKDDQTPVDDSDPIVAEAVLAAFGKRSDRTRRHVTWRDRSGKIYGIYEMTSSHIRNSMRMMLRDAEYYKQLELNAMESFICMLQGEMAIDDMDRRISRFERESAREWVRRQPIMFAFHHELQRRRVRGQNVKAPVMSIVINRVRGVV